MFWDVLICGYTGRKILFTKETHGIVFDYRIKDKTIAMMG